MTSPHLPRRLIHLHRQPDGTYIDWGRHGPGRSGPARWYRGEDAEVLRLILKDPKPDQRVPHDR